MNLIKFGIVLIVLGVVILICYTLYAGLKKPYVPPEPTQFVMPVSSGSAKDRTCTREKVVCSKDSDCDSCIERGEGVDIRCQSLSPSDKDSTATKYCLPVKPVAGCDETRGGTWVWGGDTGTETMQWECFCQYPEYFSGSTDCSGLNPDVCSNGGTQGNPNSKIPTPQECTCPKGYSTYVRTGGMTTPLCVKNGYESLYVNIAKV